jgi:Putative amidase domain
MATYDRKAAVAYAQKWCESANPAFPSPGKFGNTDCTNFVSQCLYEGGWQLVDGWVGNRSDNSRWWFGGSFGTTTSYSWGAAENLRQFCKLSKRTSIARGVLDVQPGDILFFVEQGNMAGHVAMVTATATNDVIICQHSSPQNRDRKISEWLEGKLKPEKLSPGKSLDEIMQQAIARGKLHVTIEAHLVNDMISNPPPVPQPGPGPKPPG